MDFVYFLLDTDFSYTTSNLASTDIIVSTSEDGTRRKQPRTYPPQADFTSNVNIVFIRYGASGNTPFYLRLRLCRVTLSTIAYLS